MGKNEDRVDLYLKKKIDADQYAERILQSREGSHRVQEIQKRLSKLSRKYPRSAAAG